MSTHTMEIRAVVVDEEGAQPRLESITFDEIHRAIHDAEEGNVIKPVLEVSHQ